MSRRAYNHGSKVGLPSQLELSALSRSCSYVEWLRRTRGKLGGPRAIYGFRTLWGPLCAHWDKSGTALGPTGARAGLQWDPLGLERGCIEIHSTHWGSTEAGLLWDTLHLDRS